MDGIENSNTTDESSATAATAQIQIQVVSFFYNLTKFCDQHIDIISVVNNIVLCLWLISLMKVWQFLTKSTDRKKVWPGALNKNT